MIRKRLDLYSADQADLIYPHKAYNNYQPCWFRPEDPDYLIYPKAEQAKCISVTLNPGEMIVQPAGWFHQVYALDSPNMGSAPAECRMTPLGLVPLIFPPVFAG